MNADSQPNNRVLELGKLTPEDLRRIGQRRRNYNRLGFGYQVAFVRLENRFPVQTPFELNDDLLTFVAVQTDIAACEIEQYTDRQQTISEHRAQIREYLSLTLFEDADCERLEAFLFDECCRLEQTAILRLRARDYLRNAGILEPGRSILDRVIGEQRRRAREHIFALVHDALDVEQQRRLSASWFKRIRTPSTLSLICTTSCCCASVLRRNAKWTNLWLANGS